MKILVYIETNKINFKTQAKKVANLITASKRTLYRTLVSKNAKNPKKLWPSLNSLLTRTPTPTLPSFSSSSDLATLFLFFW